MTASIETTSSPVTTSIERLSALAAWTERFARASAEPRQFAIRERPFTTQVNLRGNAANPAFISAVRGAVGCEPALAANTFNSAAEAAVIWLGPDEWLVVDGPDRGEAIATHLRKALAGVRHSVTDVSAARTVIEIGGTDARLVLAKGCPLDVHASVFAPPRTAQTLLAKARVLIQCTDAAPVFRLFVLGSFADYLAAWLTDAAAECAASRGVGIDHVTARLA
ncbi:MAG: sarcosine oxidase subunit gamma [Betaproteobacteria bacterium]